MPRRWSGPPVISRPAFLQRPSHWLAGPSGIGVLVDNQTGDRTYMNIKRTGPGRRPGSDNTFRFLVLAEDADALENMRTQKYLRGLAAEATGRQDRVPRVDTTRPGTAFSLVAESGASVAATARLVQGNSE